MALSQKLEIRQNQRLRMTPQLRQAIGLLQMNNAQLVEYIQDEVEKNPLLELAGPITSENTEKPSQDTGPHGRIGQNEVLSRNNHNEYDALRHIETIETLRENLINQIRMFERDTARIDLACSLVDELDERGFLYAPMFEIAGRLDTTQAKLEDALALLQSCEPTGVGARNLPECFQLQLRETGSETLETNAVLRNLELLAAGNIAALRKRTGITTDKLHLAILAIKGLNPRPVSGVGLGVVQIAPPDVIVSPDLAGGWSIELNTNVLPKALINEHYKSAVTKDGKDTDEYINKCRVDAQFLVKAVDQRAKTILRVATSIVKHQNRFFDKGVLDLKPLTMREVSEELGIHESTVSRVINDKFLYCPRGSIAFRFFFAQRISRNDGKPDVAVPVVRERIRELIAIEPQENVLSDEIIAKTLQQEGVDVARRTVAKYREYMGIPSSSRRRRMQA